MGNNFLLFTINQSQIKLSLIFTSDSRAQYAHRYYKYKSNTEKVNYLLNIAVAPNPLGLDMP